MNGGIMKNWKIASLCLLAASLMSCGSENDDSQTRFGKPASPNGVPCTSAQNCPSTGFCDVTPFEGQKAKKALSPSSVNSGYFDKTFEKAHVDSLLKSSGIETWNYILAQGVPIYKVVEEEEATCKFFSPLQKAPESVSKRWKSFSQGQGEGRSLLGLFNTKFRRRSIGEPTTISDFSITVREDTERWTLLHEFKHYLYTKDRVKNPQMPWNRDLLDRIQNATNNIQLLQRNLASQPTPEVAERINEQFQILFNQSMILDRRGPLEEFSIESYLLEEYAHNNLQFINSQNDVQNAVSYMRSNQRSSLQDLENILFRLEEHQDVLVSQAWVELVQENQRLIQESKAFSSLYWINSIAP